MALKVLKQHNKAGQDIGIGVDIEEVMRFSKLGRTRRRHFLERVFTSGELKYCFSKKDPAQHLAARFCAKEAVVKALGSMGIHKVPYPKIEVIVDAKGVPQVILHASKKKFKIQISLSHARDYAIACAVVV